MGARGGLSRLFTSMVTNFFHTAPETQKVNAKFQNTTFKQRATNLKKIKKRN